MGQKILIFGGNGMIGHTLFTQLFLCEALEVYATLRSFPSDSKEWSKQYGEQIFFGVDVDKIDAVVRILGELKPDVVINCIGLTKRLQFSKDPLSAITLNAQWPQRLALLCKNVNARLIHMSTDCVFDGEQGNYTEDDIANATDLYGKTKSLGEVDYEHCLTLRTSMIGHELREKTELLEWFLAQKGITRGFCKAIFSGITTLEMANIIVRYVLPHPEIYGIYNISSQPISKYELLKLVAQQYNKKIEIVTDRDFKIDRSLNSNRFRQLTGYVPPSWIELIGTMHQHYLQSTLYNK